MRVGWDLRVARKEGLVLHPVAEVDLDDHEPVAQALRQALIIVDDLVENAAVDAPLAANLEKDTFVLPLRLGDRGLQVGGGVTGLVVSGRGELR